MDPTVRAASVTVSAAEHSDVLVVRLSGDLDAESAVAAQAALVEMTDGLIPPARVVLDLTAVDLLSAAGVRVLQGLVGTFAERNVGVRLAADPDSLVHSMVRLALQDHGIGVHTSVSDALRARCSGR
ncbi:hypothetical protein GCM10011609_33050 [Lentzea pudingi]|uniref:STAS domain-containing protein n=1 Tax=Lentzea pudingi TaxID=1789439 RepID=A0ABQ2HXL2_9PSEU|nr:STAS domain-containing protein [Lentzea pudingi]GGM92972.1 hypothetical protein GCM10011609_33050 [Lentzea pudingi]